MRLLNRGKNTIVHDESHIKGSACHPDAVFSVSDKLGEKLKALYPKQLQSLDDALAHAETLTEDKVVPAKDAKK